MHIQRFHDWLLAREAAMPTPEDQATLDAVIAGVEQTAKKLGPQTDPSTVLADPAKKIEIMKAAAKNTAAKGVVPNLQKVAATLTTPQVK